MVLGTLLRTEQGMGMRDIASNPRAGSRATLPKPINRSSDLMRQKGRPLARQTIRPLRPLCPLCYHQSGAGDGDSPAT